MYNSSPNLVDFRNKLEPITLTRNKNAKSSNILEPFHKAKHIDSIPNYANQHIFKEKKHLYPIHISKKSYDFHTSLVKSESGLLVSNRLCSNELYLEKIMGMKKRVNSLEKQRNYLNYKSLGDKHYLSPERSSNFYNLTTVSSCIYEPPRKHDKRSIREQLGHVDGIFTTFLKNPLMRNK